MYLPFTYHYLLMLYSSLKDQKRIFLKFSDTWDEKKDAVLVRHDVDVSLQMALQMAQIEAKHGYPSTFFIMIDNELYNPYAVENKRIIHQIAECGHEIGLHFVPEFDSSGLLINQLKKDAVLLSEMTDLPIRSFSIHRPSPHVLNTEFLVKGFANAYESRYFSSDKYISDSNNNFRCGDPLGFINAFRGKMLQLCIHPIWWSEEERTPQEKIVTIIDELKDRNISYLKKIVKLANEFY